MPSHVLHVLESYWAVGRFTTYEINKLDMEIESLSAEIWTHTFRSHIALKFDIKFKTSHKKYFHILDDKEKERFDKKEKMINLITYILKYSVVTHISCFQS